MHSITAAMIGERLYEIGRRCNHPFLDSVGGVVVTGIDTASPAGCTAAVEVSFDDGTRITTALSQAILCWQPTVGSDDSSADAPLPADDSSSAADGADESSACQRYDLATSLCPDGKVAQFDESVDTSSKPKRTAKRKTSAKSTKSTKRKSAKKTATA